MKSHQQTLSGEWHLDASSSTITWFAPSAAQLRVAKGSVWITRSDHPEDIVLRPGEVLRVEAGDRLIVGLLTMRASADLGWRLVEEAAPTGWHELAGALREKADSAVRRVRATIRRLSLTEQEVLSV